MNTTAYPKIDGSTAGPFLERLFELYADMDSKYGQAAEHYGFSCSGCLENCCNTLFYHYTYIEYMGIEKGFAALAGDDRIKAKESAADVCRKIDKALEERTQPWFMCPVNRDGRCLLYESRPMICRLFGIPHELSKPGGEVVKSPGCETFSIAAGQKTYYRFDRTDFYYRMAKLESALRQAHGLSGKIKMTVAEMILSFD